MLDETEVKELQVLLEMIEEDLAVLRKLHRNDDDNLPTRKTPGLIEDGRWN